MADTRIHQVGDGQNPIIKMPVILSGNQGTVYNDELLRIPGGLVVEWNRAPDAAMNVLDSSKMRGPSRQMLNKTMPAGTNFKIGYCRCRVE